MSWAKGNQFWRNRSKHGRDKLFNTPELLWEAACEYFQWCQDNPFEESVVVKKKDGHEIAKVPKPRPFTLTGLCLYLDCNHRYFTHFENGLKDSISKLEAKKEQHKGKRGSKKLIQEANEKIKILNDFNTVCAHIRATIYDQKFSGAASGFFKENIIARELGLTDKKDVTRTKRKIVVKKTNSDE